MAQVGGREGEPLAEVTPPPTGQLRLGKALSALAHSVAAILLTYIFLILLMTVMAQQIVVTRLAAIEPPPSYSSAYAQVKHIEGRLEGSRRLNGEIATLAAEIETGNAQERQLMITAETLSSRAFSIYRRVARFCGFEFLPAGNTSAFMWFELNACARRDDFPELEAAQVNALDAGGANLPRVLSRAREINGQLSADRERLADFRRRAGQMGTVSEREAHIREAFDDLAKLRRSWLLGGGMLVEFPPTLLQIPLAFASGAFGALLLTLVLLVYPSSNIGTSSPGRLGSRTLLGGLIAVCVYIVLLGGTAVLGTSGGFAEGSANYMTFCAVGILAGMFSDRVAAWLSDRANIFFQRPA